MSLAAPQWWWALAALVVPLAIHLLSRGRRQRIAIGTVRHLVGAESRALRRLRLTNWPLLLLRMATLAALALALVGPRLPRTEQAKGEGRWVLIDPELTDIDGLQVEIPPGFLTRMESSIAGARSVRVLTRGLPEHPSPGSVENRVDIWSLLREADSVAPKGTPFTLFSFDRVELLRGRRPHLARPIDWHVVEDTEPNQWLERVDRDSVGNLVATIGESWSRSTRFRTEIWKAGELPAPDSDLLVESDSEIVRLSVDDRFPEDNAVLVPPLGVPLRVALSVGEDRSDDAWYLRQAVKTVGQYMGRPVRWVDGEGEMADLLIELGESTTEPRSDPVVLVDREVASEPCQGWAYASSALGEPWTRLLRCATDRSSEAGMAWWVDGWGKPFISRLPNASASIYRLEGRFNPRWSDLVSTVALPRLLLSVLEGPSSRVTGASTARSDRRGTTGRERIPGRLKSADQPDANRSVIPELLSWLLVTLLLVVERIYSRRSS